MLLYVMDDVLTAASQCASPLLLEFVILRSLNLLHTLPLVRLFRRAQRELFEEVLRASVICTQFLTLH